MTNPKVVLNNKYGNWLVLSKCDKPVHHYLCRCECGNEKPVYCSTLLRETSTNCKQCRPRRQSPQRRKCVAGKMFNDWKVIGPDPNDGLKWIVCCKCGLITKRLSNSIVKGTTRRCKDCAGKNNRGFANYAWRGHGQIPMRLWRNLVRASDVERRELKITIEQAWNLFEQQNCCCAISGVKLCFKSGKSKGTASIDRIDSSKCYELGNIQWVHKDVNTMKSDLNQSLFLEWCEQISEYQRGKRKEVGQETVS